MTSTTVRPPQERHPHVRAPTHASRPCGFHIHSQRFFRNARNELPEELEERLDFFTGESEFYPVNPMMPRSKKRDRRSFFSKTIRILIKRSEHEDLLESQSNPNHGTYEVDGKRQGFDKELFVEAEKIRSSSGRIRTSPRCAASWTIA